MDALAFQLVVVIEALRVDQRDIALAVFGDDLFGAGLDLVGEFGKVGARL